jgi:hypothetical protein
MVSLRATTRDESTVTNYVLIVDRTKDIIRQRWRKHLVAGSGKRYWPRIQRYTKA